ncbi:hypothetical protein AAFF_G00223730 [Aldrovandia affinis]|uniref:Peroxisomal membrane protein 11A n=1 Tax=Aldrovandia affinis TaxID=143900 RepID=A0AAD7TAS5_9TELE|nr:hypothetical protein AAFF_G00223730 [Aldrovandia affinis]
MESFIKFTNQSQGKDRIFRATQYACAFLKYLMRNKSSREELVKKLHDLESSMSSGRKLFRLGNTVNSLDAARQTLHLSDPVLRLCLTVSNLNRALYFICDNVLWARNLGLIRDIDKERWRLNASRYYYFALVMSLTRDAYFIAQIMVQRARRRRYEQKVHQHPDDHGDAACVLVTKLDAFLSLLYESLRNNPPVVMDTVKNVCDLVIPLDRLGIYQTNAGVVGFCGLVSSLLGILSLVRPTLKMAP